MLCLQSRRSQGELWRKDHIGKDKQSKQHQIHVWNIWTCNLVSSPRSGKGMTCQQRAELEVSTMRCFMFCAFCTTSGEGAHSHRHQNPQEGNVLPGVWSAGRSRATKLSFVGPFLIGEEKALLHLTHDPVFLWNLNSPEEEKKATALFYPRSKARTAYDV